MTINGTFSYLGMHISYTAHEDRSNTDEPLIVDINCIVYNGAVITPLIEQLIGDDYGKIHTEAVKEAEYKLIRKAA